jgi:hypothetical protein
MDALYSIMQGLEVLAAANHKIKLLDCQIAILIVIDTQFFMLKHFTHGTAVAPWRWRRC